MKSPSAKSSFRYLPDWPSALLVIAALAPAAAVLMTIPADAAEKVEKQDIRTVSSHIAHWTINVRD
ncbi:hypothetical protein HT136_02505 [Novosphingobium profundi]|uniref:hypothetical protein n=1 Tax=Novosphingobium profundi TaxID=1774954 RepID=UPI001BD9A465|nr:hypothetical protein [Novosphingobium profundi]MBT0667238.1 hypothetical protein [Novosphingobium profundi]